MSQSGYAIEGRSIHTPRVSAWSQTFPMPRWIDPEPLDDSVRYNLEALKIGPRHNREHLKRKREA